MKTIMSRISRSKTADPDVTAEDRSDAAKAYEDVAGIKLYDDQGNYKDFSETLSELAAKWDTLTDAERNYIAEQSAGVRNVNVFTTMMNKYSQAMDLANGALEDTDFAEGVQDKWMESMQGKLNTLRASMQEFWHSVLDTGVLNLGIEGLTSIVNLAEQILGIFGSIKSSIGGLAGSITSITTAVVTAIASIKTIKNIKSTGTLLGGLGKTASDTKSGIGGILGTITSLFSKDGRKSLFGGLKSVAEYSAKEGKGILEAFTNADGGIRGLAAGFGALAGKIGISTTALLGFTGAFAAIGVGIALFNHFTDSTEETAKAVEDLNVKYRETQTTFKNNKETIDSIGLEWETLSKGVNSFGENISLTTEEFSRYHELCNQIAEMYPQLVSSYDSQGNAILNLKGNLEELNKVYEDQVLAESNRRLKEDADTYQENFNNLTGNRSWNTELLDNFGNIFGSAKVGGRITAKEALDALKEVQNMNAQQVQEYIKKLQSDSYIDQGSQDILSYLQSDEVGLDLGMDNSEWNKVRKNVTENINSLNAEVESAASDMRTLMQDYLNTLTLSDGTYSNLDDKLVKQVSSMFSNISADKLQELEDEGSNYEEYIDSFMEKLSSSPNAKLSLNRLFSIDENTSIEEIKNTLDKNLKKLSEELDIDKTELKIQLGLTDEEELVKKYDTVVNKAKKKIEADSKTKLDDLLKEADQKSDAKDLSTRLDSEIYKENRDGIGVKKEFDYATTYYDEANSKSIVLTPVLPNGALLSQEELDAYAKDLLEGKEVDADITLATFKGKDAEKQAKDLTKETNKLGKAYDNSGDYAKQLQKYIKDNNINTQEQLDLLNKCVQETDSFAEAAKKFELQDISDHTQKIEELKLNLEKVKENIDKINEASDQSHESMGLTTEQIENVVNAFSGLDGYNYDKLFESTAAGVHLNVQELEKLNAEYERTEKSKYTDELAKLEDEYAKYCIQIEEATTATERNELISKRNNKEKEISQLQELIAQYDGLTNSVTKFQQAMEGGEEGDTYDYIAESAEEIKRLYDEGLTGTKKFKSYVQMMTNEDMSGKSNKEYIDMYEKQKGLFESIFTEDSASGAQNFLEQLTKITDETGRAMASYDKLNNSWQINNADAAEIAKELGISEGAIAEIFKKLSDFGFNVNFTEETDHLKAMREEAEKANKEFNDFSQFDGFKEFKFDLKVTDEDALKKQIDDAEKLRKELIKTFGDGSDEVNKFDAQLDYLKATAGQTIDALNFDLNYNDDKDELNDIIDRLKLIEGYEDLKINFDATSANNFDNQISAVTDKLEKLKGDDGRINLEAEGASELMDIFIALINKKNELSRPAVAKLDINDFSGKYQSVMEMIQNYQTSIENLNKYEALAKVDVKYESVAEDARAEVDKAVKAINESEGATAKILTKLDIKPGSLTQEELDKKLAGLNSNIMVKAGFELTEEAKKTMGAAKADATKKIDANTEAADAKVTALENEIKKEVAKPVKLALNSTAFDEAITEKTKTAHKTVIVDEKVGTKASGKSELNGTAHISGTALAGGTTGNWGLPKDETALVGEVAPELRVNSKTGQWELLGSQGAEFRKLNKGDIIFNGEQTEEIFKKGYIKSRGKALFKGTVGKLNSLFKVGSGSAYAGGYSGGGQFGYSGSGSNMWTNDKDKDKDKKEEEPKESDFDWIEVLIDRIERAIQRLDTIANSAYKSLTKRNNTLAEQFGKITEEINLQQQAYQAYINAANSVGLSETYAAKVRNGTMQIETIVGNDELVEKINKYKELYEKALDAQDAILELQESLGDIAKSKFDNVVSQYDAELSEIEHRIDMIEGGLDMVEAKGNLAGKRYFEVLIEAEQQNISKLEQQYNALQNSFNEAMNSGAIEANSEAYYDMQEQIRDVQKAWQDARISLIEYQNQMREMDWEIFEKMIDYQSAITDESDFIRELMSFNDNDLFDKDTGKLSDKGQAVGGLHAVDYNVYMAQADEYRKKVDEINAELAKDPTNTTLLDKKQEYLEAQREAILNAEDEKQAIKDLISDSYERMLDILQELIDKRKEALQAEKDLYDYQKNVEEQTKNITDLQKQLLALEGDNSEEAKSKRQQLEDQLKNAQSDLEETEYDYKIM